LLLLLLNLLPILNPVLQYLIPSDINILMF
jgi:hypothetical protein